MRQSWRSPASCNRPPPASFLQRELEALRRILDHPNRPLVLILGGAKVSDKLALMVRSTWHWPCLRSVEFHREQLTPTSTRTESLGDIRLDTD
jgi:hypothetical protein